MPREKIFRDIFKDINFSLFLFSLLPSTLTKGQRLKHNNVLGLQDLALYCVSFILLSIILMLLFWTDIQRSDIRVKVTSLSILVRTREYLLHRRIIGNQYQGILRAYGDRLS